MLLLWPAVSSPGQEQGIFGVYLCLQPGACLLLSTWNSRASHWDPPCGAGLASAEIALLGLGWAGGCCPRSWGAAQEPWGCCRTPGSVSSAHVCCQREADSEPLLRNEVCLSLYLDAAPLLNLAFSSLIKELF